jgi:hypothetical protein
VYDVPYALAGDMARRVLVATGGVSPESQTGMGGLPPDFFTRAADAVAASIPHAERQTIEGQGHVADPQALAPVLERFFRQ